MSESEIDPEKYGDGDRSPQAELDRKLRLLNRTESRFHSWQLAEPGFEGILKDLRENPPPPTAEGGMIYKASGKRVWHLRREAGGKVYDFAYKTNPGKARLRYIINSALTVREVRNYLLLESLGLPVPHILAVGDVRSFFVLKETFLVTGFIADTRDGRDFDPRGPLYGDVEKKMRYCRLHLEQLARIHNANVFHKSYHPRNLLWRERGGKMRYCKLHFEQLAKIHNANVFHKSYHPRNLLWRERGGKMEIFLIDVPRCRREQPSGMFRAAVTDLHSFFRDMIMPRAQVEELVAYYQKFRTPGTAPTAEEFLDALIHFRRRPFSRRKYKLFAEEE